VWLQHLLPKNWISAVVYRVARSERRWIKGPLIRGFARAYAVDLHEAEHTELDRYPTFNAFFPRALKPAARPLEGDERTVVAPADGVLTELGTADGERLLQAKGIGYSLDELLGENGEDARALHGGSYATIYLAPRDYHRVHLPIGATPLRTRYIPGARFSVGRATAASIERLFCRNERAVCWFDTARGPMAVVLVGALNVSSISTFALGEIVSGTARHWQHERRPLQRGAEIARFNLGSTVIVLFGPDMIRWDRRLASDLPVKMGTALGRLSDGAPAR
jgi:phosphatidylserine decarboxylase